MKGKLKSLEQRVVEISTREPDPDCEYYAVTILATEDGNICWHCYSHWRGWGDESLKSELREASLVKADAMASHWRNIGENCAIVNTEAEMKIFFLIGGNALIEQTVAQLVIADWLKPHKVYPSGRAGFALARSLPKGATNKAPLPRLRMRVLKRDDYRCRICGRRSSDHVDVELHVHHIRPSSRGGLSEEDNLITLCQTCHKGLDPHFDHSLYYLVGNEEKNSVEAKVSKFYEDLKRYRKLIKIEVLS